MEGTEQASESSEPNSQSDEPRVIGSFGYQGTIQDLMDHHAVDHPRGMRIQAPPGASGMQIDLDFLKEQLGAWSLPGVFALNVDGHIELDRRNAIFHRLEFGHDSVFTLGSNDTIRFESRPMWVNLTTEGEGIILGLDDGDPSGQEVFLSKEFLYSHGIHRPNVTHEDGTPLEVRLAQDGSGYWVDVPHFSSIIVNPDGFLAFQRQFGVVSVFGGTKTWHTDTNDLFVSVQNTLTSIDVMLEVEWFEANMPHVGLKDHTWEREHYNGDWYYVVSLSGSQTPTDLHFMQFRPTDDWVYTLGNPENLYVNPFNATAQQESGPIRIKMTEDSNGVDIEFEQGGTTGFELLVADAWAQSLVGEDPVVEVLPSTGPWAMNTRELLFPSDQLLLNVTTSVLRVWDSASGPLVPPDYDLVEDGIIRSTGDCASRYVVIVDNGTLQHEGPGCFTGHQMLLLEDAATMSYWRYDGSWRGEYSAAMLCGIYLELTEGQDLNWAGIPCLEYAEPAGSLPAFLTDACNQYGFENKTIEAFCGSGLTRYEAAGMLPGLDYELSTVLKDVVYLNDPLMNGLNEMLSNNTLMDEVIWLDDVKQLLFYIGLNRQCLEGLPVLVFGSSVPDQACGDSLTEVMVGNQTVQLDEGQIRSMWAGVHGSKPCDADHQGLVVLDGDISGYCGAQLPMIRDELSSMFDSIAWTQECPGGQGVLMAGFDSMSSSWVCGHEMPNPDESLDRLLTTSGVEVQEICYVDDGDTGGFVPGDPVYLAFTSCGGDVKQNHLRLYHPVYASGSKVSSLDDDFGKEYSTPEREPIFRFGDREETGFFDEGDAYYLCVGASSPCGSLVEEGWIRMTPYESYPAGSLVAPNDDDVDFLSNTTGMQSDLGLHFLYWDANDNGVFNGTDVLYWSVEGNLVNPSPGHVRLGDYEQSGGFGEILDASSPDVIESIWYPVQNWAPCESEASFVLDPYGAVPNRLCGETAVGLHMSLNSLFDHIENWVEENTSCQVGEIPFLVVGVGLPVLVCGEPPVVNEPLWQDYLLDLEEISPCMGEVSVLDLEQVSNAWMGPGNLTHHRLCGENFVDVSGSLGSVATGIDECASGSIGSLGISPENVLLFCGIPLGPEIAAIQKVVNPCGDQMLILSEGDLNWTQDEIRICDAAVPEFSDLLDHLTVSPPSLCGYSPWLLAKQGQDGLLEICGWGPEMAPHTDSNFTVALDLMENSNPCQEGQDFLLGFNTDAPFGICGQRAVDPAEVLPMIAPFGSECTDSMLCAGVGDLLDELVSGGDGEDEDLVQSVVQMVQNGATAIEDCVAVQASSMMPSVIGDHLECNKFYQWIVENFGSAIAVCQSSSCDPPSGPNIHTDTGVDPIAATFTWTDQSEQSGDSIYTVFVDTVMPPRNAECLQIEEPICGPIDLKFGSQYFWQVRVEQGPDVIFGPTWTFRTSSCYEGWCPTFREDLFMEYAGKIDEESLCRALSASLMAEFLATQDANFIYEACYDGLDSKYRTEDPDMLLLETFGEEFDGDPGGGGGSPDPPNPDPDPPVDDCGESPRGSKACTVVMLRGIVGPLDIPPHTAPQDIGYDDWAGIKNFYEARDYDVDLLDYYGGVDLATDCAADRGAPFGDVHDHVHRRDHFSTASGCSSLNHDYRVDWRHMAYHVAWYLWEEYSETDPQEEGGHWVDVVAHSMGGMIMRYALQQVALPYDEVVCDSPGAEDEYRCLWPPYLLVEDVVTLGTPHKGTIIACAAFPAAAFAGANSVWEYWLNLKTLKHDFYQLWHLCRWTQAVKDLASTDAPQGDGPASTRWSLVGSWADEAVRPVSSQVDMDDAHRITYPIGTEDCILTLYFHNDYYKKTTTENNACWWEDTRTSVWWFSTSRPQAVKLSHQFASGSRG